MERNPVNLTPWRKGKSGNPRGRPRGPRIPNVRAVLAPHGKFLAETAVGLVDDNEAPVSLRIAALQLCFEYLWGKPEERPVDEPEHSPVIGPAMTPEQQELRGAIMQFLASYVKQKDDLSQMSKEELLARRAALLAGNGPAPPGVQPSTEELIRIAKGQA